MIYIFGKELSASVEAAKRNLRARTYRIVWLIGPGALPAYNSGDRAILVKGWQGVITSNGRAVLEGRGFKCEVVE